MEKSPFMGDGAGKNQISGTHGEFATIKEQTGPASKAGKASRSHPSPGGKTEGPSGDVGHLDWNPRQG